MPVSIRWASALVVAALAGVMTLSGPAPALAAVEPHGGTMRAEAGRGAGLSDGDEPEVDEGLPPLATVPLDATDVPIHLGPGTVQLTTNTAVIGLGKSARLTARVDQPLEATASVLVLLETGADDPVQTCTAGTSCTADVTFSTGGPRTYIARVDRLTSNAVTLEREPWTVTLSGPEQFAVGGTITFTVLANQNTGGTDGNYTAHVQDLTTGEDIGTCTTNTKVSTTTFSCYVSAGRFYAGDPHDHRAVIAHPDDPTRDVQAVSNTVTVQRTPWTVTLSGPAQFPVGGTITLTVLANQNTGGTDGNYTAHVQDLTTGESVGTCTTDTRQTGNYTVAYTCRASTRFYAGDPHDYRAVIAHPDDPTRDIQAISNILTVERRPWTITLESSASQAASGQYVTFTATMNQRLQDTAGHYVAHLVDATTGRAVDTCAAVSGSGVYSRCSWRIPMPDGAPRVYRAVVASPRGPNVDVQAISNAYVGPTLGGPNQRCESSGGTNPSQSVSQRCHGDPVNSATGEFFDNAADLTTEGDLLAPAWTRSYGVTRAETDLGLGHGWTFGYAMSLSPDEGDDLADAPWVEVRQENGSVLLFARDGEGGFVAASRVLATLESRPDGTFRLQRHGGDAFDFDPSGRLSRVEDRNANAVVLTYDPDGHLVSAADLRGRALTVAWADGRIAHVTDPVGRTVSYAYSADGDLTEVTMPDGTARRYEYDGQHRVVALVDALGAEHRNVYDSQSRVARQTDPLGNVIAFGYTTGRTTITQADGSVTVEEYTDGQLVAETIGQGTARAATTRYVYGPTNHVVAVTDPVGRITQFTHDARGNVLTEVDPLGRVTRSTYDDHDNLLTRTDATGATWTYEYDERGNLVSETDPLGAVTTYVRNSDGTVAGFTDPLGRTTTYDHDRFGNVVAVTDAAGSTSTRATDALGQTRAETDARGGATSYQRDAMGRITSMTAPDGATTTFDLDAAGNVLREVGPDGAAQHAEFDPLGRVVTETAADGAVTLLEWDPAGNLVAETAPDGGTTRWSYDPDGSLMAVTDALDRTVRYTRDRAGRMTGETMPSGALVVHGYDAAGQHVSTRDALGHTTQFDFDRAGRPERVVDAEGRATTTARDAAGRALSVTRGDGTSVAYAYDLAGQLTEFTDADGGTTTYAYDAAGRLAVRTDAAGRATTFGYDAAGNPVSVTAPDGTVTTRTFDAASRVTGVDHRGQQHTAYEYDAAGRRTSMTDPSGTTRYAYDAGGRLAEVDGPNGTVRYDWTATGDLASLTYPDGSEVRREYDAAGQLVAVTDWDDGRYTLAWDDDGLLSSTAYPNGVVEQQKHDAAGQATSLRTRTADGATLLDLTSTYTPAGLLASETSTRADGSCRTSTYDWDEQSRVSAVAGDDPGDVGFDAGDRVALLVDGTRLGYDSAGQLTSATRGTATTRIEHDGRGNRTLESGPERERALTFDAADRLVGVTDAEAAWAHTYDGDGLLSSTTTTHGAAVVGDAVVPPALDDAAAPDVDPLPEFEALAATGDEDVEGEGLSVADEGEAATEDDAVAPDEADKADEVDAAEPPADLPPDPAPDRTHAQSFTWSVAGDIALLLTDGARRFLYLTGTAPVAQGEADGTMHYLHGDAIGSVRAVTDATGEVVASSDYQPYGQPVATGDTPVSEATEFGYAGERADGSGLLYLRARWYDPATASFLSVDPLVDLTRTLYGYTRGNPLQFTDPLGLFWGSADVWDDIAFGLGVVAIVSGPAAPFVAAAAVVAAAGATTIRIRNGDPFIDVALSGIGIIPGVGSVVGRGITAATRIGARSTGVLTRMTASHSRRGTHYIEAFDRWVISPGSNYGSAWRDAWCANLI